MNTKTSSLILSEDKDINGNKYAIKKAKILASAVLIDVIGNLNLSSFFVDKLKIKCDITTNITTIKSIIIIFLLDLFSIQRINAYVRKTGDTDEITSIKIANLLNTISSPS